MRKSWRVKLPSIEVNEWKVRKMMLNVSSGKGLAFDGVHDSLFHLEPELNEKTIENNKKKIKFCQSLLEQAYWDEEISAKHLIARLIPLNKKHPKVSDVKDYRPIIVMSPVVKFLEGLVANRIQEYITLKM